MPKYNKNQVQLSEVYKHYKEESEDPVDYKTHKAVLDLWGAKVREALLDGKDIKLFFGLSTLGVRKRIKRTFIDRKASLLAGKRVMGSNSHSGFYAARVLWRKNYAKANTKPWMFFPGRKLSRALAAVMTQPEGHKRFLIRAQAAKTEEQRRNMYNKKVLGL